MNPENLGKAARLSEDLDLADALLRGLAQIKDPGSHNIRIEYINNGLQFVFPLPSVLKQNLSRILTDCREEIIRKASEL